MLVLMAAMPADKLNSHLVICNASGEMGDLAPHQVDLLANLHVWMIHDADKVRSKMSGI